MKDLQRLLKRLFNNPNWQIIEVEHGFWDVDKITDFGRYKSKKTSVYEIYYSNPKNQYKLECKGYKCKHHPMYKYMVNRLNIYRNKTMQK